MPRNSFEREEYENIEAELIRMEQYLISIARHAPADLLTREYITAQLEQYRHPQHTPTPKTESGKNPSEDIAAAFALFLEHSTFSASRAAQYRVLLRSLQRFALYCKATHQRRRVTPAGLTAADLTAFADFLRNEREVFAKYPRIYEAVPCNTRKGTATGVPPLRSNNTMVATFGRLRAFFKWCNRSGVTDNNPFERFEGVGAEQYGTPYFLTLAERDQIAAADLSHRPALAVQRDIFIFQCFIGCRVSDLIKLTPAHIIAGGVEYIAKKTEHDRAEVIRVPLHPVAVEIIQRYAGSPDGKLLPFITPQKYNDAIREIFTLAGITRTVTRRNPTTGAEEQVPLNQIAASHIARRTFAGNLYDKVKDPNVVGRLTGHKEGSKAFARYRDIGEEMKRGVIDLLT